MSISAAAVGLLGLLGACDPPTFEVRVFPPSIQDMCPMVGFDSYAVITTRPDAPPECVVDQCARSGPNVFDCLEGGETSHIDDGDSIRVRLIMLDTMGGGPPAVVLCGESPMGSGGDVNEGDSITINLECESSCDNPGCDFANCRSEMMASCELP